MSARQLVVEAWTDMGPSPRVHRAAMDHLHRTWPTLYHAIEDLVTEDTFNAVPIDGETRGELVAALVRMYTRSRAAGVPEEEAVEGVIRRALP